MSMHGCQVNDLHFCSNRPPFLPRSPGGWLAGSYGAFLAVVAAVAFFLPLGSMPVLLHTVPILFVEETTRDFVP